MNWIFEAYSNVYNAAMLQEPYRPPHVATAKNSAGSKRFTLLKSFLNG
jgi:hypothetical protein